MSTQDLFFQFDGSDPVGANQIPTTTVVGSFSTLSSGDYATVSVSNTGLDSLSGLGLWIAPATWVGEVDTRLGRAAETDLLDLIKMGDQALEDGGPPSIADATALPLSYVPGGIWVRPDPTHNTIWYRVCSLRGISPATRIGSTTIAGGSGDAWLVFIEPPTTPTAMRYFFDIQVDDAS